MSITLFVKKHASHAIETSVNKYFKSLVDVLNELEIDTEQCFDGLNSKIKDLQSFCNDYIDQLKVTGDFIRYCLEYYVV